MGYLSILFSISDRINKQKNLVRIEDLNNTVIKYDIFDVYRAIHSINTLSFQVHMECSVIPEHKVNLSKFQRIEIIQNYFGDYSRIKLEINNRKLYEISNDYTVFIYTLC